MNSATGSIYFGDPRVDEQHPIIWNTHSILPSFEVCLKMTIKWTQGHTLRRWSCEFGDALQGRDRASLEMHLVAAIKQVWRCNWKPWSSDFGDALGGHDWASLDMHFEALIERVWTCTWRPWSIEIGGVLGGSQSEGGTFRREAQREQRLYSVVNS
jgi:hypothetical protein